MTNDGPVEAGEERQAFSPHDAEHQTKRPATILIFKTERARAAFISYLELVRQGRQHNPSIALMLEQLDQDPVVMELDVNEQ